MHCSELDKYKDLYEIVAACDIEQERLDKMAQRYPKCRTYLKYDDFLKDKNMEMVAVAVRSPDHTEFALKALKAGKYVFLEKPIALSYADAKRLVAAAKKYPGKLYCRHNRRFEQAFNHVLEIIRSGILGEVYEIRNTVNSYQRRDDWQAIIECGGGQLNNWGPHIIDHMLQMLESPVAEVWSDLKKVTAVGDAEDHVRIILKGQNKRLAEVAETAGCPATLIASPDELETLDLRGVHPEIRALVGAGFDGRTFASDMAAYMQEQGCPAEVINGLSKAYEVKLVAKAMLYDRLMARRAAAVRKVAEAPKVQEPRGAAPANTGRAVRARALLNRNPNSTDALAALFEAEM